MRKRDYMDYIQDILDSINDIRSFIEGINIIMFPGKNVRNTG